LISLLVFVKNWAFTGNPFFPFLSSVFPSAYWTPAAAEYFGRAVQAFEISHWTVTTYLLFPLHMTLTPRLVDVHPGVVPLLLTPLLFMRSATGEERFLKAFLGFHLGVWLILHTETRSLLTLLAVLLVVAVAALERLLERRPVYLRPVVVLLAAAALGNLAMAAVSTWHLTRPMDYFIGRESRADYLLREAHSQPTYRWLDSAPEAGRALLVGLHGPYHLSRPAYFSSFADPPAAEVVSAGADSVEALARTIESLHISHVVVDANAWRADHEAGLYSWSAEQRGLFEGFIRERCEVVARFGAQTVYRVGADA
jgi:hypothetical protein